MGFSNEHHQQLFTVEHMNPFLKGFCELYLFNESLFYLVPFSTQENSN